MMNALTCKIIFGLSILFIKSMSYSLSVEITQSHDFCKCEPCVVQKFFILNNLIFFTQNPDIFKTFNAFNLSSGTISSTINSTTYLPKTDFKFQQVSPGSKTSTNRTSRSLIWIFAFDIDPEHCQSQNNNPKRNSYCSRMKSLRNVVVGRLTNQRLLFVGYRNGKLVPVNDMSLFVEFHALFKHLDEFGYTSSITYDQTTDQFFSTHYGRMKEICVTKSMQTDHNVYVLPSMSDIMNADIFHTTCYDTPYQYTSILDINGSFYAVKSFGEIDQITLNSADGTFEIIQSNLDKLFFNCYGSSPILGKLPVLSFEFQLAEKALGSKLSSQELAAVNEEYETFASVYENTNKENRNNIGLWTLIFILSLLCMFLLIPFAVLTNNNRKIRNFKRKVKDYFSTTFSERPRRSKAKRFSKGKHQTSRITIRTLRQMPRDYSSDTFKSDSSKTFSKSESLIGRREQNTNNNYSNVESFKNESNSRSSKDDQNANKDRRNKQASINKTSINKTSILSIGGDSAIGLSKHTKLSRKIIKPEITQTETIKITEEITDNFRLVY